MSSHRSYISLRTEEVDEPPAEEAHDELPEGVVNARGWHGAQQVAMCFALIAWILIFWMFVLLQSPSHMRELFSLPQRLLSLPHWVMDSFHWLWGVLHGPFLQCLHRSWDFFRQHWVPMFAGILCLLIIAGIFVSLQHFGSEVLARVTSTLSYLRETPVGIFLLDRWLRVQDMGTDAWIAFCPKGVPLCPDGGLWWGEDSHWGHVSSYLLLSAFIWMWILSAPTFVKQICRKSKMNIWLSALTWALLGPFAVLFLDMYMILQYPCSEPRIGWLLDVFQLQKLTESLLAAPPQLMLQGWIMYKRAWLHHCDSGLPWALCLSASTSMLSCVLSLLNIIVAADAQGISFRVCLKDSFLVGLGRCAPLVQLLHTKRHVAYDDEGALTEKQVQQIARVARFCPKLQSLSFSHGNALTSVGLDRLFASGVRFTIDGGVKSCYIKEDIGGHTILWTHPPRGFLQQQCQRVHKLVVAPNVGFEDVWCASLPELRQLRSLDIGHRSLHSPNGCRHIKEFLPQLTNLTIGDANKIESLGCGYIKELQKLSTLTIGRNNRIGPEGCRHIKDLKQLTSLTIEDNNNIGAQGCQHIKEMLELTSLAIGSHNRIGKEGCSYIKGLQQLACLSIGRHNGIGAKGCEHIQEGLPQLQCLVLHGVGNDKESVEEEFFEELRHKGVEVVSYMQPL